MSVVYMATASRGYANLCFYDDRRFYPLQSGPHGAPEPAPGDFFYPAGDHHDLHPFLPASLPTPLHPTITLITPAPDKAPDRTPVPMSTLVRLLPAEKPKTPQPAKRA